MTTAGDDGAERPQVPSGPRTLEEALAIIADLTERLAGQLVELGELRGALERQQRKLEQNSTNSDLPPSSDGPGAASRGVRRPWKGTGRKRGGQKGHPGNYRRLLPEADVTEFVNLYPKTCGGCARELVPGLDLPKGPPRRYQQVDLGPTGGRQVKETRRHGLVCDRCRASTWAAFDASVPRESFGPHLRATMASVTGHYHVSRRGTQRMMREVHGIEISLGALSHSEAKISNALAPAYQEIERAVQEAPVKHLDATSWLRTGKLRSLFTVSTPTLVFYRVIENGKMRSVSTLFAVIVGILVSDRAGAFGFWAMKKRQICWAHLLRKFVSVAERGGPIGALGRDLVTCTALLFDYWKAYCDGRLTREELVIWMRPVQKRFEALVQQGASLSQKGVTGVFKNLLAHERA